MVIHLYVKCCKKIHFALNMDVEKYILWDCFKTRILMNGQVHTSNKHLNTRKIQKEKMATENYLFIPKECEMEKQAIK